jgi:four helix bundle protein
MGSASEAEYQIFLSFELGFINQSHYEELSESIGQPKRMLHRFIEKLRSS